MDYYLQALQTMHYILNSQNNPNACFENWVEWISKDITDWEFRQNTDHHIRAYGGMGSFNDLPQIRGGNGNYSIIFDLLRCFCYRFAHLDGKVNKPLDELEEEILHDICNADYHPYKVVNEQVTDCLRTGTLLRNIDVIR